MLLRMELVQATKLGKPGLLWQPSLGTGAPEGQERREQGQTKRQGAWREWFAGLCWSPGTAPAAGQALSYPDLKLCLISA